MCCGERSIIRLHYRRRSIITFNLLTIRIAGTSCTYAYVALRLTKPLPQRNAHRPPPTARRAQLSSIANLSVAFATKRVSQMSAFAADAHIGLHFRRIYCGIDVLVCGT